jgi:hypothetical protein
MVFVREVLAPGPGTRLDATFRWRPFQSALSGSLFSIPPPLVEVMIPFNIETPNGQFICRKDLKEVPLGEKGFPRGEDH